MAGTLAAFSPSLGLQITLQNPFVCSFGCHNYFSMRISELSSVIALRRFNEVYLVLPSESETLSYPDLEHLPA